MAATLVSSTPQRQPFGILDNSKLRHLQSIKNRQNAIAPSPTSLKRRAASPENSDSENVDPNLLDLVDKRKRASLEHDVSLSKPSRYSLNISKPRTFQPSATPRLDTLNKSTTPVSAPPAAGRSPTKPKRSGLSQHRHRFVPPSIGLSSPALSISAALNGTLASKKPRKIRTLEESKPKSWFFDIFEEPDQVQNDRMNEWTISQSATCLDISDDESKSKDRNDRGKENIDPNEVSAPLTRSMAAAKAASQELKKDIMVEDRSPLGDLNPTNYFPEGLNATSVVLVHDDAEPDEKTAQPKEVEQSTVVQESDLTYSVEPPTDVAADLDTSDIGAVILSAQPDWDDAETIIDEVDDAVEIPKQEDLEIWESESAKDENEKNEMDQEDNKSIDCNVFALQEL